MARTWLRADKEGEERNEVRLREDNKMFVFERKNRREREREREGEREGHC